MSFAMRWAGFESDLVHPLSMDLEIASWEQTVSPRKQKIRFV
jgi:hypothetical protein